MGVLEDAIREHLDLKRKHGASDAELNEQEAEALGPARRDVPETDVADAEHADGAESTEVAEPAAETAVEPAPEVVEPVDLTPVEEAPVDEAPVEHSPVEPTPVEEPDAPPAATDQDTVIYQPGDAPVPPEEGDDDPDFGGEGPAQKPPQRDFDFE
jgi:hypothetical protein